MTDLPLYMTRSRLSELEHKVKAAIGQVLNDWVTQVSNINIFAQLTPEHDMHTKNKPVCCTAEYDQIRLYFGSRTSIISLLELPDGQGSLTEHIKPVLAARLVKCLCQSISKAECDDFSIISNPEPYNQKKHEMLSDLLLTVTIDTVEFAIILKRNMAEQLIGRPDVVVKGGLASRSSCLEDENVQLELLLDGVQMNLHDLKNMKKGQVFMLSAKVNDPLFVRIGERVIARAFVGKKENHKALIISHS